MHERKSIFNNERKLSPGEWVLTLVRRNDKSHTFLILEGSDEKEQPIRKRAELGFKEVGPNQYDQTRTEIYYHDLNEDKIELMRRDQSHYVCRTFIINSIEKQRFEDKIEADQDSKISYNVGGHTKISGFFGASLISGGSDETRISSMAATEKKVAAGGFKGASGHSSLATLRDGHNCLSWAEETICYINPNLDPRGKFAKYVIAIPQIELTKCVIL